MTAEALLSRQYLGWPRDYPPLVKGAAMVARNLEESPQRNIYYWYYATQLLHNMKNKDWKDWNVRVRDGLVGMQTNGAGLRLAAVGTQSFPNPTCGRAAGAGAALCDRAFHADSRSLLPLFAAVRAQRRGQTQA